jgi:hypothetical protein
MPDLQPSMPSTASALPPGLEVSAASSCDDSDYALGCECANPALQIERWMHEASAGDAL